MKCGIAGRHGLFGVPAARRARSALKTVSGGEFDWGGTSVKREKKDRKKPFDHLWEKVDPSGALRQATCRSGRYAERGINLARIVQSELPPLRTSLATQGNDLKEANQPRAVAVGTTSRRKGMEFLADGQQWALLTSNRVGLPTPQGVYSCAPDLSVSNRWGSGSAPRRGLKVSAVASGARRPTLGWVNYEQKTALLPQTSMTSTKKESIRWAPQPTQLRKDDYKRRRIGTDKLEMSNGSRRRLPKELDAAPAKGKNGMAPGLDGVTQEMLTNISPNTKDVDKRCTVEGMAVLTSTYA
ncbi:hypothetical protein PoB_000740300 [Plakobranchus ocellatus]|uniref:Uncharacterized protein n=1 Tax=Plakobranchus ocellatus TaxID=259542 RepID=A0AAV3YEJ8_9GAST|nr:hypothetical protein PoB_000740300 [Plakobranchus ocellatus]